MRLNYQLRKWIMEKVEQYIQEHTMNCSNLVYKDTINGKEFNTYNEWLTPDQARAVAKIAREETINEVCEWIKYNNENGGCSFDGWENDLKKHLNSKL